MKQMMIIAGGILFAMAMISLMFGGAALSSFEARLSPPQEAAS